MPTALQQPQTGGQTEKFLAVDFQSVGLLWKVSQPAIYYCCLLTVFENQRKSLIFNNASEASYVYIFSGQKFINNAKNGQIDELETCGQIVLPDRSISKGQNW